MHDVPYQGHLIPYYFLDISPSLNTVAPLIGVILYCRWS